MGRRLEDLSDPTGRPPHPCNATRRQQNKLADPRPRCGSDPLTPVQAGTNVVYGPEKVGKNFVYQLCRKLGAKEEMSVPSDQVNTPTYNRDLAMASERVQNWPLLGAPRLATAGFCD